MERTRGRVAVGVKLEARTAKIGLSFVCGLLEPVCVKDYGHEAMHAGDIVLVAR